MADWLIAFLVAFAVVFVVAEFMLFPFWKAKKKRIESSLATYDLNANASYREVQESTPRPPAFEKNQGWRDPTGIQLLEQLKGEFVRLEQCLENEWTRALRVQERLAFDRSLSGTFSPLFAKWYVLLVTPPDESLLSLRNERSEQLDRLWAGDIYSAREDRKDELRRLKESSPASNTVHSPADRIIRIERELKDLEEIERRAKQRATVSPHHAKRIEAEEIRLHDLSFDIRKAFKPLQSKMELLKLREDFARQIRNGPYSQEQKDELMSLLGSVASDAEMTAVVPPQQQRPGSIYKEH